MKPANRRCKTCRKKVPAESAFVSQLRAFCSFECLSQFTKSECGQLAVVKNRKAEIRERKEKLKTRGDYVKDAQKAFNAYVRYRDRFKPCISCGKFTADDNFGGNWDAGHYRSTGSAPHLRFGGLIACINCWRQCVHCNRYLSGSSADYRINLIRRIGQDLVDRIESDNTERKWSIEQIQRITAIYRKRKRIHEKINKIKQQKC